MVDLYSDRQPLAGLELVTRPRLLRHTDRQRMTPSAIRSLRPFQTAIMTASFETLSFLGFRPLQATIISATLDTGTLATTLCSHDLFLLGCLAYGGLDNDQDNSLITAQNAPRKTFVVIHEVFTGVYSNSTRILAPQDAADVRCRDTVLLRECLLRRAAYGVVLEENSTNNSV